MNLIIPVYLGHNKQNGTIGVLHINSDNLPSDAKCYFAIEGRITEKHLDSEDKEVIDKWELTAINLIHKKVDKAT